MTENLTRTPVRLHHTAFIPTDCDSSLAPIIFLHGMGSSSLTWNRVMRIIANKTKRKVYALDTRNHAQSEWCDEMDISALVMDLEIFMNLNHISKAVLVGHSIGGKQAAVFCLTKAQMVEKLIIEESTLLDIRERWKTFFVNIMCLTQKVVSMLPSSMSEKEAYEYVAQVVEDNYRKNYNSEALGSWTLPKFEVFPFHKNKETGCFEWQLNADVVISALKNNAFAWNCEDAQVYDKPTLFIYGKHSFMKPEEEEDYRRKYFPNSQLHIMEKGYHTLHAEFPGKYVDLVVNFLLS